MVQNTVASALLLIKALQAQCQLATAFLEMAMLSMCIYILYLLYI